ncbi:MAG: ABC transporter substrate-binding protein [Firmicutes bacterium]|nr:ABC transporter substrate-binding protein [Bacillota bacterium]
MKKKLSLIICLVLIMSLMTGCTTFNNFKNAFFSDESAITNIDESKKTIKIGVYEPLTGEYKDAGNEEKIGIELAHELYPEVLGRQIELIYADNQGDMYVAETVINELVAQNPLAILGSYGDTVTLVAGDAVKEAQIPSITLTATNPLITVNNPYYFSATFSENKEGYALADFVVHQNNKKKVATVRISGDDTVATTVNRFNSRVKGITSDNTSVVGNYQIAMDATDFTGTLNKIKESKAEAVFLALSPAKSQEFLKQANEAKMNNLLYVGTKAWNDEDFINFIKASKNFNIGYTADYAVEAEMTKMSETFINAYKNKYGQEAEPTQAMAIAFDGYLMARTAIENAYNDIMKVDFNKLAKSDKTKEELAEIEAAWKATNEKGIPTGALVREALTKLKNFEGASGMISFSGSNEANKTIVVNHIINGEVQNPFTEEDKDVTRVDKLEEEKSNNENNEEKDALEGETEDGE